MKLLWKNKNRLEEEHKTWLKKAIRAVLKKEHLLQQGELSISILDDEEMRAYNTQYRGVNKTTDVLSFPQVDSLEEARNQEYLVLGDVLINIKQAKRQAEEYDHPLYREMTYLIVHSLYHLLGYDHLNDEDKKSMRKKEEEALIYMEEI